MGLHPAAAAAPRTVPLFLILLRPEIEQNVFLMFFHEGCHTALVSNNIKFCLWLCVHAQHSAPIIISKILRIYYLNADKLLPVVVKVTDNRTK